MDMRFDMFDSNSSGDWIGDDVVCVGWVGFWGVVEWLVWEDLDVSWFVVEAMDLWLWYHVRFWSLKVVNNGGKL